MRDRLAAAAIVAFGMWAVIPTVIEGDSSGLAAGSTGSLPLVGRARVGVNTSQPFQTVEEKSARAGVAAAISTWLPADCAE